MELYELPLGVFHYLHVAALNQANDEKARQAKAGEEIIDEMEG